MSPGRTLDWHASIGAPEAYPRAVSPRRRWPIAVFVVAMVVGALAIGLFVYVLLAVSHFD
jgi:hypothetical protein